MPCIPGVSIPTPQLPSPFAIKPPLPSTAVDATLCCKIISLPNLIPPISLGVAIPPAVNAAIRNAVATVLDYADKIPLKCPRE